MEAQTGLVQELNKSPIEPHADPEAAADGWERHQWPKRRLRSTWPKLTLEHVNLLREVFNIFDTDDKGFFTAYELLEVMRAMGGNPTPQEVEAVLYELDANGDHNVDFPEFLAKFHDCWEADQILNVFNQLAIQEEGTDSTRMLTLAALEKCFTYVGDPLSDTDKKFLEIMFQGADRDGNGKLDIAEFTDYVEMMDEEQLMSLQEQEQANTPVPSGRQRRGSFSKLGLGFDEDNKVAHHILGFLAPRSARTSDMGAGHSSAHAAGGQGGPRRATSQDCEGRTSASGGPRTSQPGAAGSGQHDSRARGMQQDAIPEEGLGPDQSNSARPGSGGGGGSGLWSGRLGLGSLLRGSASRGPSSGGIMESGHSHSSHEGGLGASLRRSVTRGLSNVMQQLGSWRESLGAGASGKLGTVASGRGRSSLDRGPRSSVDQPRRSVDQPRRSVEQPRGSVELGCAERGSLHIGGCDGGGLQGPGAGGAQVAGDLGLRQGPLPVQQGLEASGAGAALPERRQGRSSCSRLGMHATVAAAMAEVDAEHAPAPSLLLPSPAAQFQLSDLYPPEPATSSPVNLGSAVGLQDNSSQNTTQQTSGTDEQSYLSGLARGPPAASPAQLPARLSSGPGSASGAGNTLDQGPAPHARPRPSSSSSASHLLGAPASVSAPEGYQAQPAAPAQQQQHPGMAGPSVTGSTTGRTAGSTDHPRSGVRAAGSRVAQDPCSEAAETQSLASRPHAAGAQSSNPAAAQQLGGGSGLDRHAYGQQAASADGNPTSSSSANSPTVLGVPGGNSRQGRSGGGVLDSATAQSDLQEVIRLSSQQRVSYGGRTSGLLAPAAGAHAHEGSRTGVLASGLSEAGFGSRGARTDGGGAQGCAQDMGPLPTPFRLQPLSGSPHSGPCGLQQAAYGATQVQHQPQAQPQSQTQPQPQAQAQAQGQAQAWPPTQAPLGSSRAGSGRLLVMPVAAAGSISSAAGRAGSGTGWLPQPGSETSPTSCAPVSDMEDEITPHH